MIHLTHYMRIIWGKDKYGRKTKNLGSEHVDVLKCDCGATRLLEHTQKLNPSFSNEEEFVRELEAMNLEHPLGGHDRPT